MSHYIATDKIDMQKFAFEKVRDLDLPVWKDLTSADQVNIKRISGAMTNIIFKLTVKDQKCQPLLLRIYGTDIFFDRKKELHYFQKLSDENFGIHLLKSFPGGRVEVWRDGFESITAPQMRSEEVSDKIAKKLAQMHNIQLPSYSKDEYFVHYYSWAEACQNICKSDFFSKVRFDLLKPEIDNLKELITSEDYEVVFGHNDLQHGNILMNDDGELMFVDFEYCGEISVGVDIANHFCEWQTDYNLPDSHLLRESWGPSVEQQQHFIRTYLKARFNKEPTDEEIEKLRTTVRHHTLLSHFHWFVWGLLQLELSDIDWDYKGYTKGRWNSYKNLKKEIFGVDALPIMP